MLSNSRSRRIAMGAALILILTLVAPAAAAPPDNPFVGSWETIFISDPIGERDITYQIGGTGHFHGRTSATGICLNQYGEATPSSMFGWGTIISEDPYVFEAYVDIYCHTDSGRLLAFEGFRLELEYDPVTDTIKSLHYSDFPSLPPQACTWRSGSDISDCPSG